VNQDSGFSSQSKQNISRREDTARILVVDDDPMVCMAIEICLERHNFRVTIADGGETGLRSLDNNEFDLMIVDIFMPHMRGFESIRIFHERAPKIPLIAMSGYAFANLNTPAPDFLRMALQLGASRCLRKPFTPAALLTVIKEWSRGNAGAIPEHGAVAIAAGWSQRRRRRTSRGGIGSPGLLRPKQRRRNGCKGPPSSANSSAAFSMTSTMC
jgi:CheY-like chemotaxis protein